MTAAAATGPSGPFRLERKRRKILELRAQISWPGGSGAAHGRSPDINHQLTSEEIEALQAKLEELRLEHRDLDDVINHLNLSAYPDQLQLKRLKKRKLRLKDSIQRIESRLIPDIDA